MRYTPMSIGELQRTTPWVWVYCNRFLDSEHRACGHRTPMALAPLVIRWGPEASSDMLRRCARCTKCGAKAASIAHPSWSGNVTGFEPFPIVSGIS
jgi:hypothetical protein